MSDKPSLGAQAVQALEIDDVFLMESQARVNRFLNPTDRSQPSLLTLQRYRVDEQLVRQYRAHTHEPDKSFLILRYFFICEIAVANPAFEFPPEVTEIPEDKLFASLGFTFAVDYRCNGEEPSPEALGAFSKNVIFHAWPYWREAAHSECARMRLPSITVPMFKAGAQPGASTPPRQAESQK